MFMFFILIWIPAQNRSEDFRRKSCPTLLLAHIAEGNNKTMKIYFFLHK